MPIDWIEWDGGEQPVPNGTLVDVEFRCDDYCTSERAEELDWFHPNGGDVEFADYDIVRYRIHD